MNQQPERRPKSAVNDENRFESLQQLAEWIDQSLELLEIKHADWVTNNSIMKEIQR